MTYIVKVAKEFCDAGNWYYHDDENYVAFDTTVGVYWWGTDITTIVAMLHDMGQTGPTHIERRLLPHLALASEVYTSESHPELFI